MPASRYPSCRSCADDAPADLLDHGGDVGIRGRLAREKARRAALVGAIEIDPLKEDHMKMEIQIDGTAESLDKGDRSRLDLLPLRDLV